MSAPTPRTDAAWSFAFQASEFSAASAARQMRDKCAELETELARLRADLARFTGDGLLDCHAICDQRDTSVAERDRLRAEVEKWQSVAATMSSEREHNANEAGRLRAEVERLKKQIRDDNRAYGCELRDPYGTIWEQAAKDYARAEKAEAALAEAKVERETVAEASLRSLESYIDKLKQFAERAEKAEAECLEQARLLGKSGEREADLLGKIERLNRVIERASVQFFHEGTDGETAAKMLTVLNEAK